MLDLSSDLLNFEATILLNPPVVDKMLEDRFPDSLASTNFNAAVKSKSELSAAWASVCS